VTGRDAAGIGPGQTLFQFVRHWSRRWNGPADRERSDRGRHVLVTETVYARRHQSEVTVNDVADELAVDQSGASRMVSQAVAQGYLVMSASQSDARRRTVGLTDAGLALLDAAHTWQESTFAALTQDWTPGERAEFHRAMSRLISRSADLAGDH